MKKIERNFEIKFDFDWAWGIEISKLKEDLAELERLGATHVDIEANVCYDSATLDIEAYCRRVETDEECKERISKENRRKDEQKRRELEQLEKLKAKYDK